MVELRGLFIFFISLSIVDMILLSLSILIPKDPMFFARRSLLVRLEASGRISDLL